ncbi:MAG: hypothetical protein MUC84_01220 [Solirubrobacteraceae bacterium]|nr:hypothetical protein [Solirubrobacteraceae bacterium]
MRGSAWWCLAAATGALLGVPSVAQAISAGSTILVSRPSGDGPLAPGVVNASRVGNHAVSDDGCRTVFDSRADGISPEDDDDRLGLFVRDSCTNTTVFVSRATGAAGAPANADALKAAISGDGTKVAFRTRATNLSAADSDTALDIYVRDLTLGTTTLVSRASGAAGAKQNGGECDDPTLSDDGSRVAFSCNATNLHPDDADTSVDVYLRDLTAATTSLVSRADTAAGAKADDSARDPAISGDGGTVAFATSATNLVAGDTDSLSDVIARDLSAQTNTLVSRQSGAAGAKSTTTSDSPDVDQDGSAVAFRSFGLGEGSGQVYVRDLTAATTTLASRATGAGGTVADSGSDQPSISDDGSRVTFSTSAANLAAADVNGRGDVYARNLLANTTTLVSATAGIGGDDTSGPGAISGNGLVVAFTTTARNLLADDADGFEVVARRVLSQNSPVLVSRPSGSGAFGGDGTAESSIPGASAASEDGRIVGFSSRTDTLSPEDDNRRRNAFVRDMRTGETRFVGRASGASGAPADADANVVAVSADGRRVAFTSQATNLGEVVPANRTQLWVRDLDTQQTLLVSRADGVGGAPADFGVFTGALSADGRRVSFSSLATNLVPGVSSLQVYVRDLAAGTTVVASRADGALGAPAPGGAEADHDLSADGRRVAFGSESAALGADGSHTQIFVRDLEAGTTTLASRANGAAGAPGQFDSRFPALDADGSRVAFETFSANLVLDDADTNRDVIVRDLATAQTILVSRASGAAGVKASRARRVRRG